MILKAKCPRCGSICESEYNGSKSVDDLYYSNTPFRFECQNNGCRSSGVFRGPYSFIATSKDVNFEDGENSIYNWR